MVEELQKESKEDIEIDFAKIKNFFVNLKNKFSQSSQDAPKDDELSLDFSKVLNFVKNNSTLCVLLLLLFLQFIPNYGFLPWGGISMRMQAEDLPLLERAVRGTIYDNSRNEIQNEVNQKYPFLPDDKKQEKINEEFNKRLGENKEVVESFVKQYSEQAKDYYRYEVEGKKYTYMPDIDPYTFLRRARNLIERGHVGDELNNGVEWDNHMVAPIGSPVGPSLHPYTLFIIYGVLSFFNSSIPLMQSATYFPIIFVFLSLIPAFFLGKKLGGNLSGFFAATLVAVHPSLLARTMWGYADTDAYNVFFPLMIAWLFVECFEAKKVQNKIILSSLLGLFMSFYAYIWSWWYLFDFILASLVCYFIYHFVYHRDFRNFWQNEHMKNVLSTGFFIVLFVGIFVTYFLGFNEFVKAPLEPLWFQTIKDAAYTTLWPNVYTTVAELNPLGWVEVINSVGFYIFLISFAGLIFLIFRKHEGSYNPIYGIFFLLWLGATIYATTKGSRFLLLSISSIAIGFGVMLSIFNNFLNNFLNKNFSKNLNTKYLTIFLSFILFSLLMINSIYVSNAMVSQSVPIVNDAWWNLLTFIKTNTSQDAIITSWWDFGHHFKFIADRKVTFDGASQNTPMAHWVGRVLLTDDEDEAVGILRMLACGSDTAFNVLYEENNDSVKSINILHSVLKLNKDDARKVLEKEMKSPDDVLNLTHCDAPQNVFITSSDMVSKAHVWSHFGGWSFEKAYVWINLRDKNKDFVVADLMSKFNYSKEKAEKMYDELIFIDGEDKANAWISDWDSYMGGLGPCNKSGDLLVCNNVLRMGEEMLQAYIQINMSSKQTNIIFPSKGNAAIVPRYLEYFTDKKNFVAQEYPSYDFDGGVLIIPVDGVNFVNLIAPTSLLNSMFTKLYFLEGHDLKHFKLLTKEEQNFGGGSLIAWNVDWAGGKPNIISSIIEKDIVDASSKVLANYVVWMNNNGSDVVIDASIDEWQSKNINIDYVFSEKDKPVLIDMKEIQLDKSQLAKSLIGMRKGEERTIKLDANSYGNAVSSSFNNQTIYFKIKVERIV